MDERREALLEEETQLEMTLATNRGVVEQYEDRKIEVHIFSFLLLGSF